MELNKVQERYLMKTKVNRSSFQSKKVDIIIPFHENQGKLSILIKNMVMSIRSNPYRITVVDDGSTDTRFINELKNFDKNRPTGTIPILQTVRSDIQLGFGGAVKLGLMNTHFPYVLVMHSDCVIESPHFMYEMGKTLIKLKDKNVKLVSARTDNPKTGDPRLKGSMTNPVPDIILEDNFASLFCFMCQRELFNKIGPLKEYPYTGYEDEEFYHRMKFYGYKQAICGTAWIKHEGGGTMKKLLLNENVKKEVDKNRDRCINDLRQLYSKK